MQVSHAVSCVHNTPALGRGVFFWGLRWRVVVARAPQGSATCSLGCRARDGYRARRHVRGGSARGVRCVDLYIVLTKS